MSIPVELYPFKTYASPEEAILRAENHSLQSKAISDSLVFQGSALIDCVWTESNFVLYFSNEKFLHVFLSEHFVQWSILENNPIKPEKGLHVGTPPIFLDWGEYCNIPMDISGLVSNRIGAKFKNLFVNEYGLYLYLIDHLILTFAAIHCINTDKDMLFVNETD